MLASKSQERRFFDSEAFLFLPTNCFDGLKGSNETGFEVVLSLLAGAVVVISGLLLNGLAVVASAVVLDGVTGAVTRLGLKIGASGRGAAVLVLPASNIATKFKPLC